MRKIVVATVLAAVAFGAPAFAHDHGHDAPKAPAKPGAAAPKTTAQKPAQKPDAHKSDAHSKPAPAKKPEHKHGGH